MRLRRILWHLYPKWYRNFLMRRSFARLVVATRRLTEAMELASEATVAEGDSLRRLIGRLT